jgi:predicted phage terminase large subunit-like protein
MLAEADRIHATIGRNLVRVLRARASVSTSLLEWGQKFFPDYFKLDSGIHHWQLAELLRKWTRERGVRAAVEAPRDAAKSTYLTFLYPLWCVCEGREEYILLFSDVYGQATKYLANIREELETNEELAKAYPHVCGEGPQWTKDGILTRNGVRIEALGAGQKVRGRRKRSERPTLIIIDDAEGDDAAYSADARTKVRDWATKAVFKAGQPGTNIIVAGTVIHRECLVAYCGNLPGWRKVCFKAIISWPTRMDLWEEWERILQDNTREQGANAKDALAYYHDHRGDMDDGSKVLWEAREDLYALMFMRASEGRTSFESEKQNNPIDPSKCEWLPENFEGDDLWFDDWPDDMICAVMALDPSKGKSDKSGDYQAIVMLGIDKNGTLLVDADMRRRGLKEMIAKYIDLAKDFKPDVAVVEDQQFQELIIPECEDEAVARELLVPIEGISTGNVPKNMRIRRLNPYVSRRRIKYKRRSAGVRILRQHMMDFPNGDHDDGPDALEMALRRAVEMLGVTDTAVSSPY